MRYMRKLHPSVDVLVSNIGEVFVPATTGHKAHWTMGSRASTGYMKVQVACRRYFVHRLVLETFVGPCPEGYEVDHINRQRDANWLGNLHYTTRSENQHNTSKNDRVDARGGVHWYEDSRGYYRERSSRYRNSHSDEVRAWNNQHRKIKRKTHRQVRFSDGSIHWVLNEQSVQILSIPLKDRHYTKICNISSDIKGTPGDVSL